jgi:hypothetical protein
VSLPPPSRAEPDGGAAALPDGGAPALPAAPTLGGSIRAAAVDFYFNSWRLVPANVLWGICLGALYVLALIYWPAAFVLSSLLAFPVAGIFRIAGLIVRGEAVSFWDGIREWRRRLLPTLLVGLAVVLAGSVLLVNLLGGLQSADLFGFAFATLAGWGLVIGWAWLLCFWPLLTDPRRDAWGLRDAARAAGYLVVAHPVRIGVLAVVVFVFLLVSTVAFAALVAISVAYAALVACRYVLPAADRLESRLAAAGVRLGPAGRQTGPPAEQSVPA